MSMSHSRQLRKRAPARRQSRPWWPLALIAGGVILLAGAWLALARGSQGGPQVPIEVSGAPRLKVDNRTVDLGDVPLGQTVQVSFTLANVGDQDLRFTSAPYVEVVEGC
jgi:hypothetical protein